MLEKRKLETVRAPFAFAKTAVMCIYMQIFAYLTDTSADRKPLNARRMHRHEYSSTRGPEDFAGHTIEAAKPSTGFAAEAATLSRPSRIRRRKFHVAESGALTVPMDRYAVTSLKAHSSLMATSPDRKCICQESDWR